MKRESQGLLLAILWIVLSGCGSGGGGGGQSSTVSGNVSNQSTAMRSAARPTLLASVMRFFSPVTEAAAGRNGIHVSVKGVEAETDPNGFFSLTGPFSGTVTVTFGNGIRSFTMDVNVPPGSTVILRDVELRDDGTARSGGEDFSLRGTLADASCEKNPQTIAVALGSQQVAVELSGSTRIRISGQGGSNGSCADLTAHVGQPVRVEGVQQTDGSLLADSVHVNPQEGEGAEEIEFRGMVTSLACPSSITVQRTDGESISVTITSATEFEGIAGCSDLDGRSVKVEGTSGDGTVTAKKIEVEE